MPEVRPFRALRYEPEVVGDLAAVVSPPSDEINSTRLAELAARHPKNAVRLDLPIDQQGDEPDDRYRRTARTLAGWRSDGTLRKDPRPSLYAYEQLDRARGPRLGRSSGEASSAGSVSSRRAWTARTRRPASSPPRRPHRTGRAIRPIRPEPAPRGALPPAPGNRGEHEPDRRHCSSIPAGPPGVSWPRRPGTKPAHRPGRRPGRPASDVGARRRWARCRGRGDPDRSGRRRTRSRLLIGSSPTKPPCVTVMSAG